MNFPFKVKNKELQVERRTNCRVPIEHLHVGIVQVESENSDLSVETIRPTWAF